MRYTALILLLAIAAAGCGEPSPKTPDPKSAEPPRTDASKGPAAGSAEERETTTLYQIEVVDAQTAFAWGTNDRGFFGSVVLKTSDGGARWTCVLRTSAELVAVKFLDPQNGVAISDGGSLYTTADGGATWAGTSDPAVWTSRYAVLDPKSPQDYASVDGIFFRDAQTGWAFGSRDENASDAKSNRPRTVTRPIVALTSDGGATWKEVKIGGSPPEVGLRRGYFVDARNGWATGGDIDDDVIGLVMRTTDGGATWSAITPNAKQVPNDVFFLDANRGWLVGATEDEAGEPGPSEVLTTADGGATWQVQAKVPTSLRSIRFVDAQNGWAVGSAGKVYRTADGGATWTEQTTHEWAGGQVVNLTDPIFAGGASPTFYGFALVAPGRGFAATDLGVYEYRAK
jgi:photosystem II stability/assembly factor-like uncharacterized protein